MGKQYFYKMTSFVDFMPLTILIEVDHSNSGTSEPDILVMAIHDTGHSSQICSDGLAQGSCAGSVENPDT